MGRTEGKTGWARKEKKAREEDRATVTGPTGGEKKTRKSCGTSIACDVWEGEHGQAHGM